MVIYYIPARGSRTDTRHAIAARLNIKDGPVTACAARAPARARGHARARVRCLHTPPRARTTSHGAHVRSKRTAQTQVNTNTPHRTPDGAQSGVVSPNIYRPRAPPRSSLQAPPPLPSASSIGVLFHARLAVVGAGKKATPRSIAHGIVSVGGVHAWLAASASRRPHHALRSVPRVLLLREQGLKP